MGLWRAWFVAVLVGGAGVLVGACGGVAESSRDEADAGDGYGAIRLAASIL
ncbi:MAG: hypothetical protein OXG37_01930 [Actinomycetia bacterium]|nr:hypothetical protein [Actinomycetes bacterium]